jgi:dipeptidyl aminopeptidase/acylaminoacyl peptidase
MTPDGRFERDLPDLLAELAKGSMPEYRDDLGQRTGRMRQRPIWAFPERWLPMDFTTKHLFVPPIRWRSIGIAILIAALVVAALFALGVGRPRPLPRPLPEPYGPAGNGLIAYASGGDIYVGEPVSGTSRLVIAGPETDHDPTFSKIGSRFVFLRKTADGVRENLLIANADGTGVRVLTKTPLLNVTGGDWSADGRTIVILSSRAGRQQMSVIDVDRGETHPLDMGFEVRSPEVTFIPPDDVEIAFVNSANETISTTYAVKPDGTRLRVLVSADATRFSPDGSKIAYSSNDIYQGRARTRTHVADADGRHDVTIENPPDVQYQGDPAWSPDGSRLLVARARYETKLGVELTLAIVPSVGGPGSEIGPPPPDGFGAFGWSPDGTEIVLGSANESRDAALIRVVDGSHRSVPRWYTASWQRVAP